MTKKKWIVIGGVAVLCLLLCLCVSMCGTGGQNTPAPDASSTPTAGSEKMDYTIEVHSESGQPLPEIGVYVYTDSTQTELVWFARTDDSGKVSFTDVASTGFVAVLTDVPAGYLVEEQYTLTGAATKIVLTAGLMEGDLNNITYKLGDVMLDFTVTDPDGKEYKLTELLEQKKAVVLNFWYLQCEPCKSEFPYLQDAYSQYSDDVAVLAMNPVNTDNAEIAKFRKDNGYTFPMVTCDPAWEKAMQLTAYPTTVVIDRFGNICFIHKGSVTEAGIFEAMFDFYSAEEYEQTIFKDLDELMEAAGVEQTVGTKENPVEIGVTTSFQVTVEPEQLMYYNIYRMTTTMYMTVQSEHAYVIYNGKTYYPSGGRVGLSVSSEDTNTACSVVFGNSSKETQTFTVTMGTAPGTMGNPYRMEIGKFTANVGAGTETGVWYTYTPTEDGLFSIEVESVTAGVNYNISLTSYTANGIGTVQRSILGEGATNEETGNKLVAINGYAGKTIQITVGTLPDSTNTYPAGTFQLLSKFAPGESLDSTAEEKITYRVNVTDENRKPVFGVMMKMQVEEQSVTMATNENGAASTRQSPGDYKVVLTVPLGYEASFTEFTLTEAMPSVSIKLNTVVVEMQTYTVKVLDASGNPISGAYVTIGTGYAQTDATGVATITVPKSDYTAVITADGYISGEVQLTADGASADVELEVGEDADKMEYTVTVVDFNGNPVAGVELTFKQDGAVKAAQTTDASGIALKNLVAGSYTVGVPVGCYTDETKAVLTAETPSVTIVLVKAPSDTSGNIYGNATPVVDAGAVYLNRLSEGADNYVLFNPAVAGVYRVSTMNGVGKVSYWGSNTAFLIDQTANTDYDSATNSYTINVKPQHLGGNQIIGITNATEAVLIIQRIGDPVLDETDLVPEDYVAKNTMEQNFTLEIPAGMKLTYVDVFESNTSAYSYVKGSDGYYHLGSESGPILYVNLGVTAPYLSMSDCMGVTVTDAIYNLYAVFYEDGVPVRKESYNACMTQYVGGICPSTDVYPLNDDLIYMFMQASKMKGWGDFDSADYLIKDENLEKIPGANEALVWMYAVCYLTEG